jgi:hypothetical protein
VTRGVRESSSRGYVPLLLTVGGQPLDSLGFPAGVCASEAGVFGDAAHRSHSSRPPPKGFSRPSSMESRIHAMRAHSGARRQVVRQQGRSVAKTREASPREATWCRDLVRQSRKAEAHESEERLQSSDTRGLSKGLEPPERRCPRPRRPLTFTRQGARVGLGRLRTKALEIARGPRADDDRHQRRYATRAVGKTTPRRRPDRESTEARTAT